MIEKRKALDNKRQNKKQPFMQDIDFKPIDNITPEMKALFAAELGPGRFARTAYRLREQAPIPDQVSEQVLLGYNAYKDQTLIGTISLTPITIGGKAGAGLIGPLLVKEEHRGQRLGSALIEKALHLAKDKGLNLALLVGDIEYYQKAGFERCPPQRISLPGPVAPHRLLAYQITEAAIDTYQGEARAERDAL